MLLAFSKLAFFCYYEIEGSWLSYPKDVLLSSFTHSRCRSMDCLFREKTHTQKIAAFLWPSPTYVYVRCSVRVACRGLSISPITRLTRAKKTYPLQRLRSESKCVMADSLWICVDYLYLVHNGVIVDPLKEPAASGTRPSSRH